MKNKSRCKCTCCCNKERLFKKDLCEDCWYEEERKRIKALRAWETSALNLKDRYDPIFNPSINPTKSKEEV